VTAGVFHLGPDVRQRVGTSPRVKLVGDACHGMIEAVAERPLASGFLDAHWDPELRLPERGAPFLREVHHVANLRIAEPPSGFAGGRLASNAVRAAAGVMASVKLSGEILLENGAHRNRAHSFRACPAGSAWDPFVSCHFVGNCRWFVFNVAVEAFACCMRFGDLLSTLYRGIRSSPLADFCSGIGDCT
jgi:hypothetical protein